MHSYERDKVENGLKSIAIITNMVKYILCSHVLFQVFMMFQTADDSHS